MVRASQSGPLHDGAAARASLVVELMGPAGVGKTTLSRSLNRRHGRIAPDIDTRLSRFDKIPFVIGTAVSLLPTYLLHHRHSRWFDRREKRSMAYLQAGLRLLRRESPTNETVTLLDHGPIYRLAFLREFGPEITTTQPYRRWWANLLNQWAARMNMVISLDAPDTVLLDRIRARGSWHMVRDKTDQEAYAILRRYRTAFEETLAEALAVRRFTVLRFDTSRHSPEEIAADVLATLARTRDSATGVVASSEAQGESARR